MRYGYVILAIILAFVLIKGCSPKTKEDYYSEVSKDIDEYKEELSTNSDNNNDTSLNSEATATFSPEAMELLSPSTDYIAPEQHSAVTESTLHYDDSYEYEYRTGASGNYEYNYDVGGYNTDSFSDVEGNVDMQGSEGSGYIINEYGDEVYVDAEWVDYGVIEATDEEGNVYELETN